MEVTHPGNWDFRERGYKGKGTDMSARRTLTTADVLTEPVTFPNNDAETRLRQLIGFDARIDALMRDLRLIFDPVLAETWSQEHYGKLLSILSLLRDTVPLIVFQGDVGTGKTILAETIGQRVAENGDYGVHMVKMNTQVRGSGYVGEMGSLLAASFQHVEKVWKAKGEPVIFIIDEADSLLTTRDTIAQHHEDKSGVNTILQHLDGFRANNAQVAVIAITNREAVLDPAVRRRATTVLSFSRPTSDQCEELFRQLFDFTCSDNDIRDLVRITDRVRLNGHKVPYTYSDLTLRFAIPALRKAIGQGAKLDACSLIRTLNELDPSPPMSGAAKTDGDE